MGPNGTQNFKMLLLQITAKSFETCYEFSSQCMVLTKLQWGFLNFEFPIFNDLFYKNFKFTIIAHYYQKPQLSGKRTMVEQNRVKFGTRG